MPKRVSLNKKGLDAVFDSNQDTSIPEKQKTGKTANPNTRKKVNQKNSKTESAKGGNRASKVKQTYYIEDSAAMLLDELRLQLRRKHGLRPSVASKSAIVEAALTLQAANVKALAQQLSAQ